MQPIKFDKQIIELQKPYTNVIPDCKSLPIHTDGVICTSKWYATVWERLKFLFTGIMWFACYSGNSQPPVWLSVNYPFNKKLNSNNITPGKICKGGINTPPTSKRPGAVKAQYK